MIKKINTMKELEDIFYEALRNHAQSVAVELTIPNQRNTEFIVNRYSSIKNKLYYYKRTYGDNLVHNRVQSIKILAAGYGTADLWDWEKEDE